MKIIVSVLLFAILQLTAAFVSDNVEECGSLGVMSTDNLPEGVNPDNVRRCADHPLGHRRIGEESLAPMSNVDLVEATVNAFYRTSRILQLGACKYDAPYGCTGGYCWSYCPPLGAGQWCWLAADGGSGAWLKCATWEQCDIRGSAKIYSPSCGINCQQGSKACGCGCDH